MFHCKLDNADVNIIIVKITINQVNVLSVVAYETKLFA